MTTLLEHQFNFTADDLAANQQGQLSVEQQEKASKMQATRWVSRVILAFPLWFALSIMLLTLLLNSPIQHGIILASIALFILSGPAIGSTIFHRFAFDFRKGSLHAIHNVRRHQFVQIKTKPINHYELNANGMPLVIHQRQWNALNLDTAYDIYYYSGRLRIWDERNSIASINPHEVNAPMISELEHHFDFLPTDNDVNKSGVFSDDQRLRIQNTIHAIRYLIRFAIISGTPIFLFICGIVIDSIRLDHIDLPVIIIYLVTLFAIGALIFPIWNLYQWKRVLRTGKIKSHTAKKANFEGVKVADNTEKIHKYRLKGKRIQFEIDEAQYTALDDEQAYRFYYFPVRGASRNHTILAIE